MASPERLWSVIFFIFKVFMANSNAFSDFGIAIPEVTVTISGPASSVPVHHEEQIVPLIFEQPSAPPQFEVLFPPFEQSLWPPQYFPSPPYQYPPLPPPVIILNGGGKNKNKLLPLLLLLLGNNKKSNNYANYSPYSYPYLYGGPTYYDDRYSYVDDSINGVKRGTKRDSHGYNSETMYINYNIPHSIANKGNVYEIECEDDENSEDKYVYHYEKRARKSNASKSGSEDDKNDDGSDGTNVDNPGPVLFPTVRKNTQD